MARINLFMILAVLIASLAVVSSNHRARKLVTELERQQERMRALEAEWTQLQLEQGTWASHARVEQIARDKLGMHPPRTNQIFSVKP
jgi:cell division protein FtsL